MNEKLILKNIASIRVKKGYSQEYLAGKIGMKQSGYALIERGERGLSVSTLLHIAMALDISVIDLFSDSNIIEVKKDILKVSPDTKVHLSIELTPEKKDQVLKLVFGENNLEILNK